jgi:hypothetical protein
VPAIHVFADALAPRGKQDANDANGRHKAGLDEIA